MDRKRQQENEQAAGILKALAHPVRLCMVRGLMERGRNNVSYMESCLDVSQSGISQHLSKLKAAGIVRGTREGNEQVKEIVEVLFKEEQQ